MRAFGSARTIITLATSLGVLAAAPPLAAQDLSSSGIKKVTLLQLNDVYQIEPMDKGTRGGLARVATLKKELVSKSPDTLFLFAGDTLSPSVASTAFKGQQMIAVWNALGIDCAVLGNHEFDFGPEVLLKRIGESKFEWICANVIDKRTGKIFGGLKPYSIRDVGGVKVGLLGLLTPDTLRSSHTGPYIDIRDPAATARQYIPEMRAHGAQIIVGLTHLNMYEDEAVTAAAPIDFIVGGHEHVPLNAVSHGAGISKAGSDARNLGHIEIAYDPARKKVSHVGWELIPVTDQVADDSQVKTLVAEIESSLSADLASPVCTTTVELDTLQSDVRSMETNSGDLIADAYRHATDADVALVNGGSIRSNTKYPPGKLSKRDVVSILPFDNPVVKLTISGKTLKEALENGVSQVGTQQSGGRFPQVGGMRFEYDARRPPGSRVISITVGEHPLEPKAKYTLATNNFVAGGGDGYDMLRNLTPLISPEEGEIEGVVLLNELSRMGTVGPVIDGRIKRVDSPH